MRNRDIKDIQKKLLEDIEELKRDRDKIQSYIILTVTDDESNVYARVVGFQNHMNLLESFIGSGMEDFGTEGFPLLLKAICEIVKNKGNKGDKDEE